MKLRVLLAAGLLCTASLLVGCGGGSGGGDPSGGGGGGGGGGSVFPAVNWLTRLNEFRSWGGLPGVTENPTFSADDLLHATYLVMNCESGHEEVVGHIGYSLAGHTAGQQSNVVTSSTASMTSGDSMAGWMYSLFHGVGMIDPKLAKSGYNQFAAAGNTCPPGVVPFPGFPGLAVEYAACLNVGGDRSAVPAGFPVRWPDTGAVVDITSYLGYESPDPLTSCPGYTAPTGLPVYLQLGTSGVAPTVTGSSFNAMGGPPLEHCVYHGGSYTNAADAAAQALGRGILSGRDCIVLIPRAPLAKGTTYEVSITANGMMYSWTFSVSATALP